MLIVAIATILVAALVAYHIAFRQGVFARPNLYATFAAPAEEELPRFPTQVILIAVSRSSRDHLVVGLPLILQNRGTSTIRNLWVNLEYAKSLAIQTNSAVVNATGVIQWPDATRVEKLSEDRLRIDHELPLLRTEETMVLAEPIVFDTKELLSDPASSYRTFPIFLQSIAENVRRRKDYVQVAFVRADDIVELQSQFATIVQSIDNPNGSFIASIWSITLSRLFRKIIRRTQCLLIVPRFRDVSESVSVDEILFGNSGTGYQTAELGVYIKQMPSSRPLSWKELKQIRKSRQNRLS